LIQLIHENLTLFGGKFNLRGLLWALFGGFLYAAALTLAENLTCAA